MSKNHPDSSFSWIDLVRAFYTLIGRHKWRHIGASMVLFCLYFLFLFPTFITGRIIDELGKATISYPTIFQLAIVMAAVMVAASFGRLALKRWLGDIRSHILYELKTGGFDHLIERMVAKDTGITVGEQVQRLQNGLEQFKVVWKIYDQVILTTTATLLATLITFTFMAPWYFFCIIIVYICIIIGVTDHFTRLRLVIIRAAYVKSEGTSSAFIEGISNASTIKAQGATQAFSDRVSTDANFQKELEMKGRKIVTLMWQIFRMLDALTYAFILILAVWSFQHHIMSLGAIAIVSGYMMRITGNFVEFVESYDELLEAREGIARMMPIFRPVLSGWTGKKPFPHQWSKIDFKQVTFGYGRDKPILDQLDLTIVRHSHIGIRGETGRGKSTLIKLLVGLIRTSKGQIKIGTTNLYDIDQTMLLEKIAIVQQECELFAMSLRDNITLLRDTESGIFDQAISTAQLAKLIKKLPQGLDTLIGEKGHRLSGGERQRVALARALCKAPEILILDEATSSLDLATEAKLVDDLEHTFPDLTMIIVAHRPQALAHCDKVYELINGKMRRVDMV
ncbi:MAG: ABC transporter ATP-binding protein [Candidatus Roizmanbacteria bacterium]